MAVREIVKHLGKRKHASQLTVHEERALMKRLLQVEEWQWTMKQHALDRMEQKGVKASKRDVISTIYHSKIIEYKIDRAYQKCDERVVLRSKAFVNGDNNLHVVYSLTNNEIISVWMNHKDDRHSTLDWSIYSDDMKVFI